MMIELAGKKWSVEVVRSARRRSSVGLKYSGAGVFVLMVPAKTSQEYILQFLEEKRSWIEQVGQKALEYDQTQAIYPNSMASTQFYRLIVKEDMQLSFPQYRTVQKKGEKTTYFYLAPDFFSPNHQFKLRQNLEKYLLVQSMKVGASVLIARANYWAKQHRITIKEIFVRLQKSRLGYLTHDNRMMLNARLLFAAEQFQDYVIHHELAHTRHRNHSYQFWRYLEQIFPGAKAIDKILRDPAICSMQVYPLETQ